MQPISNSWMRILSIKYLRVVYMRQVLRIMAMVGIERLSTPRHGRTERGRGGATPSPLLFSKMGGKLI